MREVAEHQCASKVFTNNILASLVTQFRNLQASILNPTSVTVDIPSLPTIRPLSSTNIPIYLHLPRLSTNVNVVWKIETEEST